ncbi:MAG: hypothetical protein H6772_01655 [Pseudomonadales bacterium]|nr:hypothetical protein [Pseudomonadales bacterium]
MEEIQENDLDLKQSIQRLEKSILLLEMEMRKQSSIKRNFALSLLKGFGTLLGATVISAIILAVTLQVVRSIDYVPIVNNMLDSQAIETLINKFTLPQ